MVAASHGRGFSRGSGRSFSRGSGRGSGAGCGRGATANTAHATSPHVSTISDLTQEQLKAITQIIQNRPSGSADKLSDIH